MFTYTVAQYILAWLAYRLALDFFTSSPYLQRKIYSIKGHQFLLDMLILNFLNFHNLYLLHTTYAYIIYQLTTLQRLYNIVYHSANKLLVQIVLDESGGQMVLDGHISNQLSTLFCYLLFQDSAPSIFFDCNEVIDHNLMNDLIFMEIGCKFGLPNILIIQLEQIFTAIFTRVRYSRRASIKGLPNPCACFTFIYRINKKSLAVTIRRFYPIPGTPSTELH